MGIFHEELIRTLQNVCYKYVERKKEKYLIEGEMLRLVRGTITSVAHYFEDEIGRLLYRILDSKYYILVDYPIIFPGRNNRFTPDILVLEDKRIVMILELKIDLGYEKKNWRDKKEKIISKIDTYKNEMYYKEIINGKKESSKIQVVDNVPFGTIILSRKNGGEKSQNIINECDNNKCIAGAKVPYFHLLRDKKTHPNDFKSNEQVHYYFNDLINNFLDEKIQDEVTKDWIRLERFIKQHLQLSRNNESIN